MDVHCMMSAAEYKHLFQHMPFDVVVSVYRPSWSDTV